MLTHCNTPLDPVRDSDSEAVLRAVPQWSAHARTSVRDQMTDAEIFQMKIKTRNSRIVQVSFPLPVGSRVITVATLGLGAQGSPTNQHDYYLLKRPGTMPELLWLKTKGRSLHDQQPHDAK